MKPLCKSAFGVLLAFLFAAGCASPSTPLRFDSNTLTGKLDNGLTYYIRENGKPKERLELRLIVRAGSVLEDDDQQGLAHLLEHMAFNGTEHFDRQQLVDYLESIGMRFGPSLNAYTSFDQTVYGLQVPTEKKGAVDTGYQILRDWAFGIRNEDAGIEQERKVVIEEWRLGRGASQRIRDKQFPVLFQGSKYGERLPIGKKEVLDVFPPQRVRDFYNEWYRPELMAVIAVGDLHPKRTRKKIAEIFGSARPPKHIRLRSRTMVPVPDHEETLVSIVSDPEATHSSVSVYAKRPVRPFKTLGDYRQLLVDTVIFAMFNERFAELRQKPGTPFTSAGVGMSHYALSTELFRATATVKDNAFLPGLEVVLREVERARRFGFTESELARVKSDLMTRVEREYNERHTTETATYASTYTACFVRDHVETGIEADLKIYKRLLPAITPAEVQARVDELLVPGNRVVLVSGPEKPGITLPSKPEIEPLLARTRDMELDAYVDNVSDEPLLPKEPARGSIVERIVSKELRIETWVLSNGVRVLVKPTDFNRDQIMFRASCPGGHSLAADAGFIPASSAASVVAACGRGPFSKQQLAKKLAGNSASVSPFIAELQHGLSGDCRPTDLETLGRLIHLAFTSTREDLEAYEAQRERLRTSLQHRLAQPEVVFWDLVKLTLAGDHPRRKPWVPETVDEMDMARSLAFYRERFSDASGFTFVFVGNVERRALEDMVCRYIASLPGTGSTDRAWKDIGVRPPKGRVTRAAKKGADPKSRVYRVYGREFTWDAKERHAIRAMLHILQIRLREKLREEIGGTYHAAVYPIFEHYPVAYAESRISFGCAPEQVGPMTKALEAELNFMKTELVDPLYLSKAQEIMLQEWKVGLERNGFWMSLLDSSVWHKEDPAVVLRDFEAWTRALTREDIRRIANTYLDPANTTTIYLQPEPGSGKEAHESHE